MEPEIVYLFGRIALVVLVLMIIDSVRRNTKSHSE